MISYWPRSSNRPTCKYIASSCTQFQWLLVEKCACTVNNNTWQFQTGISLARGPETELYFIVLLSYSAEIQRFSPHLKLHTEWISVEFYGKSGKQILKLVVNKIYFLTYSRVPHGCIPCFLLIWERLPQCYHFGDNDMTFLDEFFQEHLYFVK